MDTKAQMDKTVKKSRLLAKSPDMSKPGKTKSLIFGPGGVGKTWFALTFPTPYYIDTEGGAAQEQYKARLSKAGGAYMGPEDGTLDFQTVIDQMQALATEQHPYRTLIIDSITKLYQTCIANESEKLGDKDAFGASKKPAIAFMRRMINWAMRIDMNIIFVAHETSEWGLDQRTGQRSEIGKIADVWDKLNYELDLVLQAQKRGNSRIAIVRKSRLEGFPDMDQFPLDYKEFANRYGQEFIEAKTTTITLATPDQIAEIKRILQLVRVDESAVEKILQKASANSWEELTTEQASSTITWLNNKLKGQN